MVEQAEEIGGKSARMVERRSVFQAYLYRGLKAVDEWIESTREKGCSNVGGNVRSSRNKGGAKA